MPRHFLTPWSSEFQSRVDFGWSTDRGLPGDVGRDVEGRGGVKGVKRRAERGHP